MAAFVLRGWTAIARIELPSGVVAAQADIAAVTLTAKRRSNTAGGVVTASATALTVASVIFDTLQNDARWTDDTTGYNFLYEVPGSVFPVVDEYQLDFVFTPAAGEKFSLRYAGPAQSTFN